MEKGIDFLNKTTCLSSVSAFGGKHDDRFGSLVKNKKKKDTPMMHEKQQNKDEIKEGFKNHSFN